MPRYIVKLKDDQDGKEYYMEWSTIVDAPVTYGSDLQTFKEYYEKEYGISSLGELEQRLKRVEQKGTSSMMDGSAEEVIEFNRAGENEAHLDKGGILNEFCRGKGYYQER